MTEIPKYIFKIGAPNVKLALKSWLFIIPFNFHHIINGGLNKYIYMPTTSSSHTPEGKETSITAY